MTRPSRIRIIFGEEAGASSQNIAVDYISSASVLYLPVVEAEVSAQNLSNDFIASGASLYEPTVNVGAVTLSIDYVASGESTYEPTTSGSLSLSDIDFINAGSATYEPNAGIKPLQTGSNISTPKIEGDVLNVGSVYALFSGATEGGFVGGDIPDGLSHDSFGSLFLGLSGTLTNDSAGTYDLQWYATNAFGTTYSPIYEFVVAEAIQVDFIASGSATYEPSLDGNLNISADYIGTGSSTYEPTITGSYTLATDFIASGASLYEPSLDGSLNISADYIGTGSSTYEPTLSSEYSLGVDYISSGASLYEPDIGRKPLFSSGSVASPAVEGDEVFSGGVGVWFVGADSGANVGDTPDGLSFFTAFNLFCGLSGTLSNVSAGTYTLQWSATNTYGTTLSPQYEFVVAEAIQVDFIASGSSLYEPLVTIGAVESIATDYIASGASLHEPSVISTSVNVSIDYLSSGTAVYEPTLGGSLVTEIDFISSGVTVHEPTFSGSYTVTVDYIDTTLTVHIPNVSAGAVTLTPPFIASTASMHEPIVVDAAFEQNYEIIDFELGISRQAEFALKVSRNRSQT